MFKSSKKLLQELIPVLGLPPEVQRVVIEIDMRKAPQVYVVGLVKERAGSLADAIARGVVVPVESVEVDDRGSVYTTPPDPDAAIPRKPLRFRCKESSCGPAPVDMDWPTADTPPRRQG